MYDWWSLYSQTSSECRSSWPFTAQRLGRRLDGPKTMISWFSQWLYTSLSQYHLKAVWGSASGQLVLQVSVTESFPGVFWTCISVGRWQKHASSVTVMYFWFCSYVCKCSGNSTCRVGDGAGLILWFLRIRAHFPFSVGHTEAGWCDRICTKRSRIQYFSLFSWMWHKICPAECS